MSDEEDSENIEYAHIPHIDKDEYLCGIKIGKEYPKDISVWDSLEAIIKKPRCRHCSEIFKRRSYQ